MINIHTIAWDEVYRITFQALLLLAFVLTLISLIMNEVLNYVRRTINLVTKNGQRVDELSGQVGSFQDAIRNLQEQINEVRQLQATPAVELQPTGDIDNTLQQYGV